MRGAKRKETSVPIAAESSPSGPVGPIALYSTSSQFNHWRYSKSGLAKIRRELNVTAVGRVQKMVEEDRSQQSAPPIASTSTLPPTVPVSSTSSPSDSPTPTPAPSEIQYLTVEDELSLVMYYLSGIAQICQGFKFPEMVEATAVSYLKRFYLRNTCMDYHPKNVMLTSIFLATKTENHPLTIDKFSAMLKTTPNEVLSLEFLVSQSLRFEYKVHHAHLAAYGLSLDLQTSHSESADVADIYAKAKPHLRASRLTDLEFIYSPSQIALACFRMIDPSIVETWLGIKVTKLSSSSALVETEAAKKEEGERLGDQKEQGVLKMLQAIEIVIREVEKNGVDRAKVTEVDKRLKWAHNPEKDPNSALFKKRKAEEDLEVLAKAAAKAAKRIDPKLEDIFK